MDVMLVDPSNNLYDERLGVRSEGHNPKDTPPTTVFRRIRCP